MAISMRRARPSEVYRKIKCNRFFNRSNQSSALQSYEDQENEVQYPPIKPKYPPGGWGDIDRKAAWILHEKAEEWKKIPTIQERLNFLETKDSVYGSKAWKYEALQNNIGLSDYQQDKTKTVLLEGAPDCVRSIDVDIDNEFKDIKKIFIDKIMEEQEILFHDQHFVKTMLPENQEKINTKLIQSVVLEMMTLLSPKHEHLLNCQFDLESTISAYWERYGVRDFKPKPDKNENKFLRNYGIPFTMKYDLNYSKYQSKSKVSCQLRTVNPLPEFLSRDDEICTKSSYPECRLWPNAMGTGHEWLKPKSDPGYLPQDPYQFVNLSFIPRNHIKLKYLKDKLGEEIVEELMKHYGMNSAFISTVGQAYNQGFSTFADITYPLTTQLVMTDGRLFSIYCYQLNTLHLWKDDEGNPLRNICYLQDSLPLYDIIENNELKGFNDDTFKALMRCFLLKPVNRGYELRPTLPPDSPDAKVPEEFIPKPKEEIIIDEQIQYDQT